MDVCTYVRTYVRSMYGFARVRAHTSCRRASRLAQGGFLSFLCRTDVVSIIPVLPHHKCTMND